MVSPSRQLINGILNVVKGVMVVMKGKQQGNLYILEGDKVTGAATMTTSLGMGTDYNTLWHLRLGHMSEKGCKNSTDAICLMG